jgi:Tol biopolymer transport system component
MSAGCIAIATAIVVLTLAIGCGTVEPTIMPVPPTDTPAPPTATPMPPLSGSGGGVIAFVSERSGTPEVHVMNADGSDHRQLTKGAYARFPAWSPDGSQIVFEYSREGSNAIYTINADGTGRRLLTRLPAYGLTWSSVPLEGGTGGAQIAFACDGNINAGICVADADGASVRLLARTDGLDLLPVWSPDGSQIAFVSAPDGLSGPSYIYVMDIPDEPDSAGTNLRRLTQTDDVLEDTPAWSPDGSHLAFSAMHDGHLEIFMINADGTDLQRLTRNAYGDYYPTWSPDGSQIAFQSSPDGQWDIYVMNADGINLQRLTNDGAADQYPAWRP